MDFDNMFNGIGATEPDAASRKAATGLQGFYVALVASGFTENQALTILLQSIASAPGNRATE